MIRFGLAKNPCVTSHPGPSDPIQVPHFAAQFVMQIWSLDPFRAGMDEKGLTVDGTKVSGTFVARNKTSRSIQYTEYTHVHTAQVMAFHNVCFMGLLFFSLSPDRGKGWCKVGWDAEDVQVRHPFFLSSFAGNFTKISPNFTNMKSLKSGKLPTSNKFFYQLNKTTLPGPTMVLCHAMARSASISCITLRMVDTS